MAAMISPDLMAQALTVGIVAIWGATSKLCLVDLVAWHFFPVIARDNAMVMQGPYSTRAYLTMAGFLLFWAYAAFCDQQRAADMEQRNSAAKRYLHVLLAIGSAIMIQGLPPNMKFPGIMHEMAHLRPVRGRTWREFSEQTSQLGLGISSTLLYTGPAFALAADLLEGTVRIPGIGRARFQQWRVPITTSLKTTAKLALALLMLTIYCAYAEVGFGRMLVAWLVKLWLKPSEEDFQSYRHELFGPGTVQSYLLATIQWTFCTWGVHLMGKRDTNAGPMRSSWIISIVLGLGFQITKPIRPWTFVQRVSDLFTSKGATAVALDNVSEREFGYLAALVVVFPLMFYSVAADLVDRLERWLQIGTRD